MHFLAAQKIEYKQDLKLPPLHRSLGPLALVQSSVVLDAAESKPFVMAPGAVVTAYKALNFPAARILRLAAVAAAICEQDEYTLPRE